MSDIQKRHYSVGDRSRLARRGWALKDLTYPVRDAVDLHHAAVAYRSGFGDTEAAGRLIARRAGELGVPNPLLQPVEVGSDG